MQREFIGRGQAVVVESELSKLGCKSVFLVTGKASFKNCGAEAVIGAVLANYSVTIFDDFSPTPTFTEAMAGVDVYKANRCEVILAVGGGSTIDIAKSINVLQAHPGYEKEIATTTRQIVNPLAPLVAIPTTAGTGSEATHFAVIYVDNKKYSLASQRVMPDIAVIDSRFTDSLPAYITACTGFDALCQSIESYWAVAANEESRKNAAEAIKLLCRYLPEAVNRGSIKSREKVMIAANLSGKAINISKTTAPHALSYAITREFNIAHGHAVALTLAEFFSVHEKVTETQLNIEGGLQYLKNIMNEIFELLQVCSASEARAKWYVLMSECGLEYDLVKNAIVSKGDVNKIVAGVNVERLGNHPVKLTPEMMETIFEKRVQVFGGVNRSI